MGQLVAVLESGVVVGGSYFGTPRDAVRCPVVHRPQTQSGLHRAPGFLDSQELLVSEGHVLCCEGVVVAVYYELPVEPFGSADLAAVNGELPRLGRAQVLPVATAGPQAAYPLGVLVSVEVPERPELGLGLQEQLLAMLLLAPGLLVVVADDVPLLADALPDNDFLDVEVVCDLLVSPRAAEDLPADLGPWRHGHADDVAPSAQAKGLQVVFGDHAGVAHEDAAGHPPVPQILSNLLHRGHIHRVAREDPVPHGEAFSGHRHPDDDLRGIPPPVLRVPSLPWGLVGLPPGGDTAEDRIVRSITDVLLVHLEVERGRVVEDDVHVQVEQIPDPEEHLLLDVLPMGLQEVHRAVEVLQLQVLGPLDADILTEPLLPAVELRAGSQGAVGHHREQGPLHREPEPALSRLLLNDLADPQPIPEGLQRVQIPVRPSVDDLPVREVSGQILGRQAPQDAASEPSEALDHLLVFGPTPGVDNPHLRALLLPIPGAVRELEVGYRGAVRSPLRGLPQVHVHACSTAMAADQRAIGQSMYLGFFGQIPMSEAANPLF